MEQQISNFDELRLLPGQKMHVELDSYRKLKSECTLIGYKTDRAIILTTPMVDNAPATIKVGAAAAVRFFANQANSVCAFRTEVIHVAQTVFPHIFLENPMLIEVGEIRKATRARVDAPCSLFISNDSKPQAGIVVDLSIDGARIHSKDLGTATGDEIQIIVKFKILGFDKIMKIPCIVRSISDNATGKFYGVQFVQTKNDEKIALHAIVMSNV